MVSLPDLLAHDTLSLAFQAAKAISMQAALIKPCFCFSNESSADQATVTCPETGHVAVSVC